MSLHKSPHDGSTLDFDSLIESAFHESISFNLLKCFWELRISFWLRMWQIVFRLSNHDFRLHNLRNHVCGVQFAQILFLLWNTNDTPRIIDIIYSYHKYVDGMRWTIWSAHRRCFVQCACWPVEQWVRLWICWNC